ncbi:TonB-dependent receptor [Acetobacter sp. P5B1]|uniref:TonB-dependent receptor n=1 Tax=Acetobacter sp. P5B1 TaxID=2762620 RepID=UPI001C046F6F|nr:TonB-dependent receptor [Acetobacter sp. P5B1]
MSKRHAFLSAIKYTLLVVPVLDYATTTVGWAATLCPDQPVSGQTASCRKKAEEIVVRSRNASFVVSSSLSRLSGAVLKERHLDTLGDVAERLPNVSFTSTTQANPVIMMRALGGPEEETSSLYVPFMLDGIPMMSMALGQIFDLDHMDVTQGPDLTRGPNVFGGMVSATSRDPGNRFGGSLDFEYGTGNRRRAVMSNDIPLGPNTALRVTVGGEVADGYVSNRFLDRKDTAGWHSWFGRLKLLHKDSAGGEWRVSLHHVLNHGGNDYFASPALALQHESVNTERGVNDNDYWAGSAQYHRAFSRKMIVDVALGGNATQWKSQIPESVFSARTGFTMPTRQAGGTVTLSGSSGTLDWRGGIFGQEMMRSTPYLFDMSPYYLSNTTAVLNNANVAGFAELGWRFSPSWRLVPSFRVEHNQWSMSQWSGLQTASVPEDYTILQTLPKQTASRTVPLPGLKLEYHPQTDSALMQYGWISYTRAYMPPGFSPHAVMAATAQTPFDASYGNNLEIGYRLHDRKDKWSAEVIGYSNLISNLQVVTTNANGESVVATAAKAHTRGMELNATFKPIRSLTLSGFLGLTYAAYDRFLFAGQNFSGQQLNGTPKSSFGFSGTWTPGDGWSVNVNVVRRGRTNLYPSSTLVNDPYVLVDAQIEKKWRWWNIAIYGRNLADARYLTRGLASGEAVAANPRLLGLRVGVTY